MNQHIQASGRGSIAAPLASPPSPPSPPSLPVSLVRATLASMLLAMLAMLAILASPARAADGAEAGGGLAGPATGTARAGAAPLRVTVLRIQDGDSFVARLADGRRIVIRIAGIDAPERTQPWAEASRRHLRSLVEGRTLRIDPVKRDAYGRTVARVGVDRIPAASSGSGSGSGRDAGEEPGPDANASTASGSDGSDGGGDDDVGLAQVVAGLAWHFRRYAGEQDAGERRRYERAETRARDARRGLWRDPQPLAPWDFRARPRAAERAAAARRPLPALAD